MTRTVHIAVALLAMLPSKALAQGLGATPQMSMAFAYAPRWGSYGQVDAKLANYDFAPVGKATLQGFGLRGRAYATNGLYGELSMSFGILSSGSPLPTTTTNLESAAGLGVRHRSGLLVGLNGGFATLTQALASQTGGGALVYQGPVIAPQVGWTVFPKPGFGPALGVFLGYNTLFPVGLAHRNPLWEQSFARSTIRALTLSVESGLALAEDAP